MTQPLLRKTTTCIAFRQEAALPKITRLVQGSESHCRGALFCLAFKRSCRSDLTEDS